jgi:gluconolactonase
MDVAPIHRRAEASRANGAPPVRRLRRHGALIVICTATAFCTACAADDKPIAGVGPASKVIKSQSGFTFTEGPAVDGDGNVYFADIPANKIHKVDTDGKLTTFLERSQGSNGLMFDQKGRLIACQGHARRVVAIDVKTKELSVIADKYNGKPFNGPNDLVIDKVGGVYFTDPSFSHTRNQDKEGVYYVAADGTVTRVVDDQPQPNGVRLSPDEKTLYVLLSGRAALMAYPVERAGVLGKGKQLGTLSVAGDGMTVDTKGNLYLTQPRSRSIIVMSPEGRRLGEIKFPEAPASVCFGGKDMRTLYVTARTSLYTVNMEATGHRFAVPQ